MKKNNKVSFILLICGTVLVVLSLVLGLVLVNTSNYYFDVNDVKVVVNSQSDECYNISVALTLYNKSGKNSGGSITLLLEDKNGRRVNASFGNVEEFVGKKQLNHLTNNSVETIMADDQNGLGYDISVVGVSVGAQKYGEKQTFNSVFIFPMVFGVMAVVLAYVFKENLKPASKTSIEQ